jgi:DNA polymerase-3 subunit alpha
MDWQDTERGHRGREMDWQDEYNEITAGTRGLLIYQEQVMAVFNRLAGFPLDEAYLVIKAIGKKNLEMMAGFKAQFLEGATSNGVPQKDAVELWETVEGFAAYCFNVAHSVAYSHLTYSTALLKATQPAAFYASCLKNFDSPADRCRFAAEARRNGITICAPHINSGAADWSTDGSRIFVGLERAVGDQAAAAIIEARPFSDIVDLRNRVSGRLLNTRKLRSLYAAGCLSGLGCLELTTLPATKMKTKKFAASLEDNRSYWFQDTEVDTLVKASAEYELFGTWLSWHPLAAEEPDECCGFAEEHVGTISLRGAISLATTKTTKTGQQMATLTLEGLDGAVQVTVFPKSWAKDKEKLTVGSVHSMVLKVEEPSDVREYYYSRCGTLEAVVVDCPTDRRRELWNLLKNERHGKVLVNVAVEGKITTGVASVASLSTLQRRLQYAGFYSREN